MTLEQIARIAGVSAATVSLALNDRPGVSRETRERILAIVKETGYRARPSGALLRGSVQFLKVVRHGHTLNEDHNVFIADYIDGLTHRAKELQLRVEIASVPGSVSLNDITHSMERQDVAGFIVLGTELTPEDVRGIAAVRKPLVFLDTCHDFLPCDFADMNNLDSVHLVVAELLATGHRTIGMVTSPVNTTNFRLRETGWRESLAYAGARFEEEFFYSVDSTFQGAYRDFAALLAAGRRLPEGLFCCNDIVCLGVAKALREAGPPHPRRHLADRVRQPAHLGAQPTRR